MTGLVSGGLIPPDARPLLTPLPGGREWVRCICGNVREVHFRPYWCPACRRNSP